MGNAIRGPSPHWVAASILLTGLVLVYLVFPPSPPEPAVGAAGVPLPSNWVDVRWQLWLCRVYVLLSVLIGLVLCLLRPPAPVLRVYMAGAIVWVGLALAHYFLLAPRMPPDSFFALQSDRYGIMVLPSFAMYYGFAAATVLLLLFAAPRRADKGSAQARFWRWLAIAYVALLAIPGLFAPISLDRLPVGSINGLAWHYEIILGRPHVGMLAPELGRYSPVLTAIIRGLEEWQGSLSWLAEIRLVQLGNAAYAGLALLVVWRRFPTRPWLWIVPLGLALPWVHTLHADLFVPNQAGWRSIGFPLAILAMLSAGARSLRVLAPAFGFLFGALVSWNVETGIACGAGLASFLAFRCSIGGDLFRAVTGFALGTAGGLAICFLVTLAGPSQDLVSAFRDRIAVVETMSNHNPRLVFDPIAILVALYASAMAMSGLRAWRGHGAALGAARRGALGVLLLVWLAYYTFYPDPWNLWSYLFVLGFAVAEQLSGWGRHRTLHRRAASLASPLAAILILVLGPWVLTQNMQAGASLLALLRPPNPEAAGIPILAVGLPKEDEERILRLASGLAGLQPGGLIVSSVGYFLAKLQPAWSPHMIPDPTVFATFNPAQVEAVFRRLRAAREPILLEDVPDKPPYAQYRQVFSHLAERLRADFDVKPAPPGWIRLLPR